MTILRSKKLYLLVSLIVLISFVAGCSSDEDLSDVTFTVETDNDDLVDYYYLEIDNRSHLGESNKATFENLDPGVADFKVEVLSEVDDSNERLASKEGEVELVKGDNSEDVMLEVGSEESLVVEVDLPQKLESTTEVNDLTIEENTTYDEVEITVNDSEGDLVSSTTEDITSDNIEATFRDIEKGQEYDVIVKLLGTVRGSDERVIYEGSTTTSEVRENEVVNAEVSVKPLDADSLTVDITGDNDAVDRVVLDHPSKDLSETKYYEDDAVVFEDDLIPARWDVIVYSEDDREAIREVLLLPTEEKEITLDVNIDQDGNIEVDIVIFESPNPPDNLQIEDGKLIWDEVDGAESYRVYKAESEDMEFSSVVTTTSDTSYSDLDGDYYYRVRSYVDGYSSELSDTKNYKSDDYEEELNILIDTSINGTGFGNDEYLPTDHGLYVVGRLEVEEIDSDNFDYDYYEDGDVIESNKVKVVDAKGGSPHSELDYEEDQELVFEAKEIVSGSVEFYLYNDITDNYGSSEARTSAATTDDTNRLVRDISVFDFNEDYTAVEYGLYFDHEEGVYYGDSDPSIYDDYLDGSIDDEEDYLSVGETVQYSGLREYWIGYN